MPQDQPAPEPQTMSKPTKQPRTVRLSSSIGISAVLIVVAFVSGARFQDLLPTWVSGNTGAPQFSQLSATYNLLKGNFAEGSVDLQKAFDGAEHGLANSLNDPYTVYFTSDEAKAFDDSLNGKFSGIGAVLAIKDSQLIIQSTIDGAPAALAGLKGGDAILAVNGKDTTGWSVEQAASAIRGDAGTSVRLTIGRGSSTSDYNIVRANVTNPSVRYSILDGNIGYMQINRFAQDDTSAISKKAADYFKSQNVKGVILDLRDNGGGYVSAAQDVASLWLGNDKTVVSERGKTLNDTIKTTGEAVLEGVPTVVLVNGNTASASEIVSGALHDYKAATLVGTKTFGKGVVQNVITGHGLPSGAELKVTVAYWYTPNGKNINKQGISPDVTVNVSSDDQKSGNDPQKAKALDILSK